METIVITEEMNYVRALATISIRQESEEVFRKHGYSVAFKHDDNTPVYFVPIHSREQLAEAMIRSAEAAVDLAGTKDIEVEVVQRDAERLKTTNLFIFPYTQYGV